MWVGIYTDAFQYTHGNTNVGPHEYKRTYIHIHKHKQYIYIHKHKQQQRVIKKNKNTNNNNNDNTTPPWLASIHSVVVAPPMMATD